MSHVQYEHQPDNPHLEQGNIGAQHDPGVPFAADCAAVPASTPFRTGQDDAFSSLDNISNGIHSGRTPLNFKHAIDSAQSGLGNRATLAFVRQQYQDTHARATNDDDSPLQMTGGRMSGLLGGMGRRALRGRRTGPAQRGMNPMVMPGRQNSGKPDDGEVTGSGNNWLQRHKWRRPYQRNKHRSNRDDSLASPIMPWYRSGGLFDHWTSLYAGEQEPLETGKFAASSYPRVIRTDKVRENKFGKSPVFNYDGIEYISAGFNPLENLVGPLPGDEGHRFFAVVRYAQFREFDQGTVNVHIDVSVVDAEQQEPGASTEAMINPRAGVDAASEATFLLGNRMGKQYRVQVRDVDNNYTKGIAAVVMPITEENFFSMRDRLIRSMTPKKPEDGAWDFPLWQLQASPGLEQSSNCMVYAGNQVKQSELLDPSLNELFSKARKSSAVRDFMAAYLQAFKMGYGRYYDDEDSVNRIHIYNIGFDQVYNDWLFRETGDERVGYLPDPRSYNAQFGGATADISREFRERVGTEKAFRIIPEQQAGMPPLGPAKAHYPNAFKSSILNPFTDLAGPVPGPSGHTDFAYTALMQSPAIRDEPGFVAAGTSFGLFRTDRPDQGVWVHPARSFIEEMPAADTSLSGRLAMYIYPVDNFDELRERLAESLFSPENIARIGPYAQFENAGAGPNSPMVHARLMESHMKLTEHPDLEIPPFQTMRETLLMWEMFQKMGYMRYPDSPEMAERVAIFNAWLDQVLEPHLKQRGEKPLPYRLPPPGLHNAAPTRHDPEHSLRVKDPRKFLHTKKLLDPSTR